MQTDVLNSSTAAELAENWLLESGGCRFDYVRYGIASELQHSDKNFLALRLASGLSEFRINAMNILRNQAFDFANRDCHHDDGIGAVARAFVFRLCGVYELFQLVIW